MCSVCHVPHIMAHFHTWFILRFLLPFCVSLFFTACTFSFARPLQHSPGRPYGRLADCRATFIVFCISSISRPLGLLSFFGASLFRWLCWGFFSTLPPRYGFLFLWGFVICHIRPLSWALSVLYRFHPRTAISLLLLLQYSSSLHQLSGGAVSRGLYFALLFFPFFPLCFISEGAARLYVFCYCYSWHLLARSPHLPASEDFASRKYDFIDMRAFRYLYFPTIIVFFVYYWLFLLAYL